MQEATHSTNPAPFASCDDFRRVFHEQTDSLYRLALILTADREKARQCFVSGLEDSVNGTAVFKDWAQTWARRTIIQNAIRRISPHPSEERAHSSVDVPARTPVKGVETAAVLQLEPFERFVYVISVLEQYSDLECSLLLGCARREVVAARIRALRQIETQMTLAASAR